MSDKTATSLFMFSPLLTKYAGFYQDLLRGVVSYQELGNRLIQSAEQAHAFRQFDKVREIGYLLFGFALKEYSSIGSYFLGVAYNSCGNGNQNEAKRFFEIAANTAPDKYKGKAIMSLAALAAHKKDYASELYFFQESLKAGKDLYTILKAHKGIAVIQSREGYHKHSLKYLETFLPLIKYSEPHVYFDYLNSYAVELSEAGRKNEARNIIKHVITSPFAFVYSEWQNTADELKESNRSFVAVPQTVPKPVKSPQPVIKPQRPARVLSFPKLKEAPLPEKPEKVKAREVDDMTGAEKRDLLMTALRTNTIRESEYNKLMFMCGLIEYGPTGNEIDLEDEMVLDDLIVEWANLIDSERLALVLSALRDCEDDRRRNDIIDRMIRKTFEESRTCSMTEEEWRLKVEGRLPDK